MNGRIKTEFKLYNSQLGFEQTGKLIFKSIKAYNRLRPHASCDYLTPEETHLKSGQLNKRWKNYYHYYNYAKKHSLAITAVIIIGVIAISGYI